MRTSTPCPDIRSFQDLIAGALSLADKESLLQHLEMCDACATKIQTLPQQDMLLSCIRQAKSPSNALEDQQLAPLVQRLIQLQPPAETPHPAADAAGSLGSVLASKDTGSSRLLSFACAGCGKPLRVKENLAGKKVKCPRCGQVIVAPAVVREPEPARTTPPETGETVTLPKAAVSQDSSAKDLCAFLAPSQAADELGRLGSYRVLKVLGRGGMGVVFRAEDPHLQRLVALKAMLPALAADESARQRFLREARAAASLKHDHIVSIYQVGEDRGAPFLAMEFLEGEALDDRLQREGKLPLPEVLRIGREIAEGLEAAHEHGLIHRDIKPGNVWLEGKRGRVKILDFGLARTNTDDIHLTQSGAIVGTPAYMPPEQARGEKVDSRCDLYSLGCVLYRLCTGELPFKGDNAMSLLMALAIEQPKSPREVNPDVPPPLADLILRLLAKDAAQRPSTAGEVAEALHAIDTGELVVVKAARAPAPSRRRLAVAVVGGALMVAAMLTVIVIRLGKPEEGTVTIETVDPDVELVFTSGGKDFTVRDKKTGKEIKLPLGTYQVKLKDGKEGLKLNANEFTLMTRDDRALVKVTWKAGDLAKSARADISAPFQVAEPPPLAEWLKGRTILTVSQDGKSQFKTIQAALNALKPHQVVKVLDRGPYRESLRLNITPEDTGLISEANTVLEIPKWETDIGHDGFRIAHSFDAVDGFRLCGFRFLTPQRKKTGAVTQWSGVPSGLVIEDCCFDPVQFLDPYPVVGSIHLGFDGEHLNKEPVIVRRCAVYGGPIVVGGKNARAVVLIENNYFHKTGYIYGYCEAEHFHKLIVRSNVFGYIGPHFVGRKGDAIALEVSNNTINVLGTQIQEGVPTGGVTVRNNIIRGGFLFNVGAEEHAEAARGWRMGHNCYLQYRKDAREVAAKAPTDVDDQAEFLSLDPAHLDYLRVPADSPLTKGGAGGAWPSYIGAFPPGPAPKDGDWFTRLRQRWGDVAPAVKSPAPPVQVPEPPLADWLKGRTILTVSQDGKSQFKTIQAALNALKPGQVVKVLDRGPYRERLSLFVVPEDTGLVSEHQTVLELSEWSESDKQPPVGHNFLSAEDFRVHGFALIFPTSRKDGIAFYVPGANGFVLENCFVQVPEKAELMAAVMIGLYTNTDRKPAWVRDCMIRGKLIFTSQKRSAIVVAERNYLDGPANQALQTNGNFGKVVIRHNVFGTRATRATISINEMKEVDSLEVRNNTTTSIHPFTFAFSAPRKNVILLNNLRSQPGLLVFGSGAEKELPAIIENWRVGHNAYPRQLRQGEFDYLRKQNIVPQASTDVLGEPKFLSLDPAHPDYLRLAVDSPLAKGGTGGTWPSYIGALPPGPAPKDGDWFTHLRERWLKDKPKVGK